MVLDMLLPADLGKVEVEVEKKVVVVAVVRARKRVRNERIMGKRKEQTVSHSSSLAHIYEPSMRPLVFLSETKGGSKIQPIQSDRSAAIHYWDR